MKKSGPHADKAHQDNRMVLVKAVMPVKFPDGTTATMVITADTSKPFIDNHAINVSLYEIGIKKVGSRTANMQSEPTELSIADILWEVNDSQGNPYVDHATGKLNYADKLFFNNEQTDAETYFQSAWHGTPHDFDTFDLGAIGTGEGAQAHGWGLYFAANKGVSEEYRARLAKHDWPLVDVVLGGIEYRVSTKDNTIERKDGTPLNSAEKHLKT